MKWILSTNTTVKPSSCHIWYRREKVEINSDTQADNIPTQDPEQTDRLLLRLGTLFGSSLLWGSLLGCSLLLWSSLLGSGFLGLGSRRLLGWCLLLWGCLLGGAL